jgi:hypothetical protein
MGSLHGHIAEIAAAAVVLVALLSTWALFRQGAIEEGDATDDYEPVGDVSPAFTSGVVRAEGTFGPVAFRGRSDVAALHVVRTADTGHCAVHPFAGPDRWVADARARVRRAELGGNPSAVRAAQAAYEEAIEARRQCQQQIH